MKSDRPLLAIVLAAGKGTRMRSATPKPLHRLSGRALVLHVLDALAELPLERVVVVVGHGSNEVIKVIQAEANENLTIEFVEQPRPLGTGDAAAVGLTGFARVDDEYIDDGDLLVLPGDAPLLRARTLASLVADHRRLGATATLLTAHFSDPFGYGRVVRGRHGEVVRIVEQADATEEEQMICEVATSVYCFRHSVLAPTLRRISPSNAQGEYYLTDTIGVLSAAGYHVAASQCGEAGEVAGVNDRVQLAAGEAEMCRRVNERFLLAGVTMIDPRQTYLDTTVQLGPDVTLLPGVVLEGRTKVGKGAVIGPFTRLVDCTVGDGAIIKQSEGEKAFIGENAHVGPFAFLGPGTRLAKDTITGPFFTGQSDSS